ncbi:WD40-repeat-containing domain protein, partial [Entophlyctis helioformis]
MDPVADAQNTQQPQLADQQHAEGGRRRRIQEHEHLAQQAPVASHSRTPAQAPSLAFRRHVGASPTSGHSRLSDRFIGSMTDASRLQFQLQSQLLLDGGARGQSLRLADARQPAHSQQRHDDDWQPTITRIEDVHDARTRIVGTITPRRGAHNVASLLSSPDMLPSSPISSPLSDARDQLRRAPSRADRQTPGRASRRPQVGPYLTPVSTRVASGSGRRFWIKSPTELGALSSSYQERVRRAMGLASPGDHSSLHVFSGTGRIVNDSLDDREDSGLAHAASPYTTREIHQSHGLHGDHGNNNDAMDSIDDSSNNLGDQEDTLSNMASSTPKKTKNPSRHSATTPLTRGNELFATGEAASSASQRNTQRLRDLYRIATTPTKTRPAFQAPLPSFDQQGVFTGLFSPPQTRSRQPQRTLPKNPETVLDAPDVRDDYYINVLDWGVLGTLIVGLDDKCYLWNKTDARVDEIYQTVQAGDYISTCAFSPQGHRATVGTELGSILLFDTRRVSTATPQQPDPLRTFTSAQGVSALGWVDPNVFLTGDKRGSLFAWDTRSSQAGRPLASVAGFHADRVVGITAHWNQTQFASGCNGHLVDLWDMRNLRHPSLVLEHHRSAARALRWCPWEHNVLATGGGLDDGKVCMINSDSGQCLATIETGQQVCQIVWSRHYREFITMQSFEEDQLVFWKYPSMEQIGTLPGHRARPLHAALSPDGQTVATMAGDETIKFWKCFPTLPYQRPLRPPLSTLDEQPATGTIR